MNTSKISRSARISVAAFFLMLVVLAAQFAPIPSIEGSPNPAAACEPTVGTC